jgi:hypothetical protein
LDENSKELGEHWRPSTINSKTGDEAGARTTNENRRSLQKRGSGRLHASDSPSQLDAFLQQRRMK